jgi:hypothetical protein
MNPELAALQRVITDVHQLMAILRDPRATAVVAQCLKALTGIQQTMMQPQQGAQQAMMGQLAGAGAGGPPMGGQGG